LTRGAINRRHGNQGVVVFGRLAIDNTAQYDFLPVAAKFFANRELFEVELEVLTLPSLHNSTIFPHLITVYKSAAADKRRTAPNRAIVPPFIVTEGGVSLKEIHNGGSVDFATCAQVRVLSLCLRSHPFHVIHLLPFLAPVEMFGRSFALHSSGSYSGSDYTV
jgi:hypothetical protein